MNVLICHERFLFRFGADRVLILLGKGLSERGHRVNVMGNRCDVDIVHGFADKWIQTPVDDGSYLQLNESTRDWLAQNWDGLFEHGREPDVVIVGGWPFFSAIPFFTKTGARVIFIDFGVVPNDGYSEGTVTVLNKLRSLRREALPQTSIVVAISRFIAESQSQPDTGNAVRVEAVLLGADHMESGVWHAAELQGKAVGGSGSALLDSLRAQDRKVLLCLGRWEPGTYKNSQAAFDVVEQLVADGFKCALLVLEEPRNVQVPEQLRDLVYPIGFPDDEELREIMKRVDLGISMSLWEGFNLPLAEMQWYGQAALAFAIGAHPEVIADSWFLCRDVPEMCRKSAALLRGEGPPESDIAAAIAQFRAYFTNHRFVNDFCELLADFETGREACTAKQQITLFMDVTSATKDPGNPGVIRVTRRLGRELQDAGVEPVFVVWDETLEDYALPTEVEYEMLGRFNGPKRSSNGGVSRGATERVYLRHVAPRFRGTRRWLFLPEVLPEHRFRAAREFAREWKLETAIIFFDAIPYLRPELCHPEMGRNHVKYMRGIAECDIAVPISKFSATCLSEFWRENRITAKCQIVTDVLPGEFGGARRAESVPGRSLNVSILCVSTLEPRKNHRNLVQACLWLKQHHPELDWSLTLVGNRYAGAFEIADWIQEVSSEEPRIKWLGIVDDATLDRLYEECSFTIYPSLLEGFGLPIVESIWHGRPCICHNQGVMAELAQAGGCLTVDVTDPVRLGQTIHSLGTDETLWSKLAHEAIQRPLRMWQDYTGELLRTLRTFSPLEGRAALHRMLFPQGAENWNARESERMAIVALLARHQPECSLVVGARGNGGVLLISQYSKLVVSVNGDHSIQSELQGRNISCLNGDARFILPRVFSQLQSDAMAIGFVYIESSEAIETQFAYLHKYVPEKPMFLVIRDSFDPECRRALLNIDWERSAYGHWIDLDFVPGKLTAGRVSDGLALAYFHPEKRTGQLPIRRSANNMFNCLAAPMPAATVA